VVTISFKENVQRSFRLARKDVERLRSTHLGLQSSTHEWIVYLARENKALHERVAELEQRISQMESSPKSWDVLNR
jgi:hypothetical protein